MTGTGEEGLYQRARRAKLYFIEADGRDECMRVGGGGACTRPPGLKPEEMGVT